MSAFDPVVGLVRMRAGAWWYEYGIDMLGSMLFAWIVVRLAKRDARNARNGKRTGYAMFVGMLIAHWWFAFAIVTDAIIYLGLPTSLTLGFQIDAILPSTCEASLTLEGRDGLPCKVERLLEWMKLFMSDDGSYHLDELEGCWWNAVSIISFLSTLGIVCTGLILHWVFTHEEKEKAGELEGKLSMV